MTKDLAEKTFLITFFISSSRRITYTHMCLVRMGWILRETGSRPRASVFSDSFHSQ